MSRIRFRSAALAEIDEAFEWYRVRSAPAAERFLLALDVAMASIGENPERYPIVHGQLRRVLLRRFPYAIYFKVYPNSISVVGVIHGHRHPDTWLHRS